MESPRVTKLIQGRSKQLNNKPRSDSGGSTEACAEEKTERKPLCAAQPILSPLGAPLDNSLTSLHWLQNVRIVNFEAISIVPEQQQPELLSASCSDSDESSCSSDGDVYQEFISNTNFRKCLDELAQYKKSKKDYTLELSKPIYSYVTLIFLAITSSSTDMTLHDICKWIKDNFCYYRIAAFGWQNSVRHNLSTNNLFVKVSRVTGKGNYWRINPKYVEFVNGGNNSLKRKNGSQKHKRCDHSQSQSVPDPCKVPGDLDWISLLGSQKVNCSKCGSIPSHSIGFSPFVSPDLNNFVTETTVPSTPEFGLHKLKANHNQNDAIFETEEQVEVPCLVQDSPFVLPGADSRPHSPVILDTKYHPWAESTPDKGRRLGLSWTSYSPHPITTAGAAPAISQW